jgi:YVTN family beta-propeller protein
MLRLHNVSRSTAIKDKKTKQTWLVRALLITLIPCFGALSPAAAQVAGNVAPQPVIVYVANAAGGITEINSNNNSAIATVPFPNNGSTLAVTPDGTRLYVSNRDVGEVQVFDTRTNVPLVVIPVGNAGENVGIAASPNGQLVYVANQFSGTVTVIDTATNHVVQTIFTGAEPIWITFSSDGSRAYVSNQVSGTVSVVDTASSSVINTIGGFSCPFHSRLTHDGSKLLVSSQCDNSLKVVNLSTNTVVNSIPTGPNPRGIALTPDGRRAYVADWFSNTLDVIDVEAQANLNTPITVGNNPLGIAMTPAGKAYVANFSDNSISVIDSSTNTVTATLPARVLPQDVIVSTTAEPRILNYSFKAFDPPGSVDTVTHAVNDRGESVGRFLDGPGVVHGFLRHGDGSFVTIDPPGSGFTVAFDINNAGTIVGIWQAQVGGAFHAFARSPSGLYTTADFPGAVDSEFTGINSHGISVGDYDLGDLSTSIAFLDTRGMFTSFDDPAAAPAETAALGLNSASFVSGFFDDPAGNEHSFVRAPNAQFQNFDFPLADFTDAYKLNDSGDLVGQYATNFPNHGFVLSGAMALTGPPSPCQFLSFDYPDSQNSGARGINNAGQITGFYRLRGGSGRHGFLATPIPGGTSNQNNVCLETASFSTRHGARFESFDFPGSTNTQATAITPSGEIVGRYNSADGKQHGFVLRDGAFTSVDVPGATFSTDAAWVNASGEIVGGYGDSRGGHAYVLKGGTFTTIDFPSVNPVCTAGFGISNAGDVVGVAFACNDFIHGHGYLFSRGQFTLVDVPGAVGTFPTMVIDSTRIVGTYFGTDGVFHGFLWQAGNFSTIDFPNSTFTWITGINPEGAIVGFYNSKDGNQHGFVLSDGEFITVDVPVPGATSSEVNGIDPQGDGVGRYITPDGHTHGYFLRCVTCSHHNSTALPGSAQ